MKKNYPLNFLTLAVLISLILSGCTPATTPASIAPTQTEISQPATMPEADKPFPAGTPYTIAEAEKLAGFDVKEPTYLPNEVSFDFATYQQPPHPNVTLFYKYGDRGTFFQIVQEPQEEALPNPNACGVNGDECETLQMGDISVKYRLTTPTESLMWSVDGFSFSLLRTAGEPGKIYKDELLQVVESMK